MKKFSFVIGFLVLMVVSAFGYTAEELFAMGRKAIDEKDSQKAFEYLKQGAEMGDAKCQCALASCYGNGEGCEQDMGQALYWFEQSAAQGNLVAQASVSIFYFGSESQEDLEGAFNLLKSVLENEEIFPHSCLEVDSSDMSEIHTAIGMFQYYLATAYKDGIGCTANKDKAIEWFKKSADNGNADAVKILKKAYKIKYKAKK